MCYAVLFGSYSDLLFFIQVNFIERKNYIVIAEAFLRVPSCWYQELARGLLRVGLMEPPGKGLGAKRSHGSVTHVILDTPSCRQHCALFPKLVSSTCFCLKGPCELSVQLLPRAP